MAELQPVGGRPPLSVVTPWIDHPELIPDYERSVGGAEVILIDNGSRPDNAALLRALADRLGGVCLRNEVNVGFAAANNQGLARATGERVLFLNDDVAAEPGFVEAVVRDTPPLALAGPSLAYQLVYGLRLPYLEGWCLAGRRELFIALNGWDAAGYPGPYWEDNDLCFRALNAGVGLVKTDWKIHHKGGQTTQSLLRWGEVFERNRAVFAARARPVYERRCAEQQVAPHRHFLKQRTLADLFHEACTTPSDINEHCATLFALAFQCRHVTEMGTRTGLSTRAFLHAQPRKLVCYDLERQPQVDELAALAGATEFVFRQADVRRIEIEETDLLFLDTWHVYEQLRAELRLHAARVRKYIVLHDTTTFATRGETAGHPGLWPAVEEFLAQQAFRLERRYENNNGLTILARR